MRTIICKFNSEGKAVKKTAILNDSMNELSKSKKNEATDIQEAGDHNDYEEWSIYFEETTCLGYEVVFKFNHKNYTKTLKPLRAITWGGEDAGVIIDSQHVSITIR